MVLYICRECGKQISSGATRCPYCGAPPRPPLYGRPWSHRLALRAAVLLALSLPLLMLPVVLRWRYSSWSPCEWLRVEAASELRAADARSAAPGLVGAERDQRRRELLRLARDSGDSGQCLRVWARWATE